MLIDAFRLMRAKYGSDWPADSLRKQDIHGEFATVEKLNAALDRWKPRLRDALVATLTHRDASATFLADDSPLQSAELLSGLEVDAVVAELASLDPGEFADTGVAQALAEQGRLPMYGMPTRTRTLYTHFIHAEQEDGKDGFEWRSMDRDLSLAVFEFSPGSVLVKDKLEHLAVGFTGPYPPTIVRCFQSHEPKVEPFGSSFGPPFFLLQCASCTTWTRLPTKDDSHDVNLSANTPRRCGGSPLPSQLSGPSTRWSR